jgi:predicted transcriptional regulator
MFPEGGTVLRRQFVLDRKTDRLLRELAADHGGNSSAVVREAIQAYAEREAALDAVESEPGFIAMMERSERDFRAGRYITLDELKKRLRTRRRRAS